MNKTQYALRTTDSKGKERFFGGKGAGSFWFNNATDSLEEATFFATRGAAQKIINDRKRMCKTGDAAWMEALDMWSRVEIVTIEISFKVVK